MARVSCMNPGMSVCQLRIVRGRTARSPRQFGRPEAGQRCLIHPIPQFFAKTQLNVAAGI